MSSLIQLLPWDTRFYGLMIARLRPSRLRESVVRRALRACARKHVQCLYFLSDCNDSVTSQMAAKYQFRLVDVRVVLNTDLSTDKPRLVPHGAAPKLKCRLAQERDTPVLQSLVVRNYSESRFARDAHFPRHAYRRMFQEWIVKSIRGQFDDCVWVAEQNRTLAGYISCRQTSPNRGRIGLVGVAARFRQQHVGRLLMACAFQWFRQKKVKTVEVVTQGTNLPAQRFYQACGFRTCQIGLWYHKWFQFP